MGFDISLLRGHLLDLVGINRTVYMSSQLMNFGYEHILVCAILESMQYPALIE